MWNDQSKIEEAEKLGNERTRGRNIKWYKHDRYLKTCNNNQCEYKLSLCVHWRFIDKAV